MNNVFSRTSFPQQEAIFHEVEEPIRENIFESWESRDFEDQHDGKMQLDFYGGGCGRETKLTCY